MATVIGDGDGDGDGERICVVEWTWREALFSLPICTVTTVFLLKEVARAPKVHIDITN